MKKIKSSNSSSTNSPEERERLRILSDYRILDTPPESELDSITKLSSSLCNTPISLISLVDENRQWFKSKVGLDICETPREYSFCQFTILGDDIYEVQDTHLNRKFVNNPLVTGFPGIRFYAGAPLIDASGARLGTLCVLNTVPGKLSKEQKESLRLLAYATVTQLSLRKINYELNESKRVLKNFFDLSPDFICSTDMEGFYIDVNESFSRKLGYEKAELLNTSFFNYIHPDDFQLTLNSLRVQRNGVHTLAFENRYRKKDGSYIWLSWNASPDALSKLIFATARDVTEQKNAQAIIKKSEESLSIAQSIAKMGSWEFNLETFELNWSKEHYKIFELEGTPNGQLYDAFWKKLHPDDIEKMNINFKYVLTKGGSFSLDYRIICNDGSIKYLIGMGETSFDDTGKPIFLYGTVQDVTERRLVLHKINENEESLNLAQSISKIGSWELNLNDLSYKWSKELFRIFEIDPVNVDRLQEICTQKIVPEDYPHLCEAICRLIECGGEINVEFRIIGNDGNYKFLHGIGKSYCDELGKLKWVKGTAQDVTESKRIERELTTAKELAEMAVDVKNKFLANMSHEIRTPMNSIIGFSDLLTQTGLDETQKEFVGSIKIAGENLVSIINDILDYSKIECGKITIHNQPFNLVELLANVHKLLRVKADEKTIDFNLRIEPAFPETVSGDGLRLSQILINLIGNAIKFTEKGCVDILAECISENENSYNLKFTVTDTGIGIPEDKQEIIFERFVQVNNEIYRKYGGTGLGLSISKNLIELMGGKLSLKSVVGNGSSFTFSIELQKINNTTKPIAGKNVEVDRFLGNRSVLVFEDNILNQRLIKNILEKKGFDVTLAGNGQEGLDKLKLRRFDILLMDLQMPDLDGFRVTDVIRNNLKIKTPILAMTAHSISGEKEKCLAFGMNDFMSKPFKQNELFQKIADLLLKASDLLELESSKYNDGSEKVQLNLEYLKEISDGNLRFEKEMLEIFLSKVPTDLELLEIAFSQSDLKAIKDQAHELMSSLPIAGFTELENELQVIEQDAKNNTVTAVTLEKFQFVKFRLQEAIPLLQKTIVEEYPEI